MLSRSSRHKKTLKQEVSQLSQGHCTLMTWTYSLKRRATPLFQRISTHLTSRQEPTQNLWLVRDTQGLQLLRSS